MNKKARAKKEAMYEAQEQEAKRQSQKQDKRLRRLIPPLLPLEGTQCALTKYELAIKDQEWPEWAWQRS